MSNDFGLSENAKRVFYEVPRYCLNGETIEDTFRRVAREYSTNDEEFEYVLNLLKTHKWRCATPVFFNAGTKHKIFSSCYVVGLEDSMDSIYDVANVARKIFQFGAGVGIPIGSLREKDAYIYEGDRDSVPEGKSSGPVVFLKLFDAVGDTTKSGGVCRRSALMSTMPVDHPDIEEFITCKTKDGFLSNMNISVMVTDNFMNRLESNTPVELRSPFDGSKKGEVLPQDLWDKMSHLAWKSADPGVIFIDTVNKYNILRNRYEIKCTNPCGELPLPPNGACNLSSINLGKFIVGDWKTNRSAFDYDSLYVVAYNVTRLMDNLIDRMDFPDPRFKEMSTKYRQLGIGIMGLADAMYMLNVKYDGSDGKKLAKEVMKTIHMACTEASADMAKEKGPFYDYAVFKEDTERITSVLTENDEKIMDKVKKYGLRNSSLTSIQPTGTCAISAMCSYGLEPSFGIVYKKNLIDGGTMMFANQIFEEKYKNEEWYNEKTLEKIAKNGGSLKGIHGIPKEIKDVFVVAHDIRPKDRIDVQAALMSHISNSISSTVNLPNNTTKEEIADIYKYAYQKGLKGITVYRDGCKENQPISFHENQTKTSPSVKFERPVRLQSDTYKVRLSNGTLYVTVSTSPDGRVLEVFPSLGKSGQAMNSMTEALGRIGSVGLQNGIDIAEYVNQLKGITDDPTWFKLHESDQRPTQLLSIPDAIAKILEKYYMNVSQTQFGIEIDERCPICGSRLMVTEGCRSCTCGFSKCS